MEKSAKVVGIEEICQHDWDGGNLPRWLGMGKFAKVVGMKKSAKIVGRHRILAAKTAMFYQTLYLFNGYTSLTKHTIQLSLGWEALIEKSNN